MQLGEEEFIGLASEFDRGNEALVIKGNLKRVGIFVVGEGDEEHGFASAVHGHVGEAGFFAEGGLADLGEGGFEFIWSGSEDGWPLTIELGGSLVDDCNPRGGIGVVAWLEEKAVLVSIGGPVSFGVFQEFELVEALSGERGRETHGVVI